MHLGGPCRVLLHFTFVLSFSSFMPRGPTLPASPPLRSHEPLLATGIIHLPTTCSYIAGYTRFASVCFRNLESSFKDKKLFLFALDCLSNIQYSCFSHFSGERKLTCLTYTWFVPSFLLRFYLYLVNFLFYIIWKYFLVAREQLISCRKEFNCKAQ